MSTQVASAPPPTAAALPAAAPSLLRPAVVLAVALGLACLPLLLAHAQMLWEKPHYQFFPWALLGAGVLAWRRRDLFRTLSPGHPLVANSLLGLGFILLTTAGYLASPWLGMVAALIVTAGYCWLFGGRQLLGALAPSLVLLAILVPPPLGLDTRLILVMQSTTTKLASRTLDLFDLAHVPLAHTLQVPGDQLLVDEACSGIASLFSVITFTLFYCFFMRRGFVHTVLLLVFATLFVGLGNVVRVAGITLLKVRYNIDLVTGWQHETAGLVIFGLCLALAASMDQAILFFLDSIHLFSERRRSKKTASAVIAPKIPLEPTRGTRRPAPALKLTGACYFGAAFVIVGLLTTYNTWINPHAFRGDPSASALQTANLQQKMNAGFMPIKVGQWEQDNYERKTRSSDNPIGHYSDLWQYRRGKHEATVSVDYPFRGGHDLTICYVAQGWHESATDFPVLADDKSGSTTTAVIFERSAIEKGYLWFSALDESGQWLSADALHRESGMNRLADRFATEASTTIQVQVFLKTPYVLDTQARDELRQLFEEIRTHLRENLFSKGGQSR